MRYPQLLALLMAIQGSGYIAHDPRLIGGHVCYLLAVSFALLDWWMVEHRAERERNVNGGM